MKLTFKIAVMAFALCSVSGCAIGGGHYGGCLFLPYFNGGPNYGAADVEMYSKYACIMEWPDE